MKLIAYARVSSRGQAEDGTGLDIQQARIREYAARMGWPTPIIHVDVISGTTPPQDREGLRTALATLRPGDVFLALRPDRAGRTLTIVEAVYATVWQAGATVHMVDGGEVMVDDPRDPMVTFARKLLGLVAELDRDLVRARLLAGQDKAREEGRRACGQHRMGESDRQERDAVARIVELRQADPSMSLRTIADILDGEGHRPRRGSRWHPSTLANILKREVVPVA